MGKISNQAMEIVEFTRYKTGLDLEIQEDSSLAVDGKADDQVRNRGRYVIKYRPDLDEYLDHIISHECGHILRFWLAEPKDRKVATSNYKNKEAAIQQLAPEYAAMANQGVPLDYMVESFDSFYDGVLTQLTNIPVDIRVEQWLEKEHPGIKEVQKGALARQIRDGYKLLRPRFKSMTPKTIYNSTTAMNYAFTKSMGPIIGRRRARPYANTPYQRLGRKLLDCLGEDGGHVGDRASIDKWAWILGLEGWFEWRDYEIP